MKDVSLLVVTKQRPVTTYVRTYEFREVLDLTGVARSQLTRWTDAGIIEPRGGGGKGCRRAYSLRNLVEVVICDRLHRLGVTETTMRKAVAVLAYAWVSGARTAFQVGHDTLWLRINPKLARAPDARIDDAAEFLVTTTSRAAPILSVVSHQEIAAHIRDGYFGIAINLNDIVTDLETRTGDRLP
jgi:hypothetical protein